MALWCDLADTIVAQVSHDDIAVAIHCKSTGPVKPRKVSYSVCEAFGASGASYCGHMLRCILRFI
jgi:hypothetical protein